MDDILLITSSVDLKRPALPPCAIIDPRERLRQYVASLLLWLRKSPFRRVVYCDNSATHIPFWKFLPIALGHGKELEILLFDGNSESWRLGKGWGEVQIIRHALAFSSLIAKGTRSIWKITGRLYVSNIDRIEELHRGMPNVFLGADTRFYKVDPIFFSDKIVRHYDRVDESKGICIEMVHEDLLKPFFHWGKAAMFQEFPVFLGRSGGTGDLYGHFPELLINEAEGWVRQLENEITTRA